MTVSLTKQTPDEWLLERYDKHGPMLHARHPYAPPIVKILDDHRTAECDPMVGSDCRYWSGAARWPSPKAHADLTRPGSAPFGPDFLRLMEAA